jgi:YgiT-type zinc finger domain-containing protein
MLCPLCGVGQLTEHTHEHQITVDDHVLIATGLTHYICAHCNECIVDATQSRHNKLRIRSAKNIYGDST